MKSITWPDLRIALLAACTFAGCTDGATNTSGASGTVDNGTTVSAPSPAGDPSAPPSVIGAATQGTHALLTSDGSRCDAAIPLLPRIPLADQQTTATDGLASTQCRPSDAPQRFYDFVLPAHYRALVVVIPDPMGRVVVRALEACDAPGCLTDDASDRPGAPVSLSISTTTG
jgi:hypothetical protein